MHKQWNPAKTSGMCTVCTQNLTPDVKKSQLWRCVQITFKMCVNGFENSDNSIEVFRRIQKYVPYLLG